MNTCDAYNCVCEYNMKQYMIVCETVKIRVTPPTQFTIDIVRVPF